MGPGVPELESCNQTLLKGGTSGADWGQAANIGKSLLLSRLVGFGVAAFLLLLAKALIKDEKLYRAPRGSEPPPFYIRWKNVPNDRIRNFRNDLYLVSEALRLTAKSGQPKFTSADTAGACQLQETRRSFHAFHSHLGEGCRGNGSRVGNYGRLEADRSDDGRKNRQRAPHLRPGSGR